MATEVRVFVLETDDDVMRMVEFLRANRKPMAQEGRYLRVTIAEHKADRSVEQNAFMWTALLTPASKQIALNGERFSEEAWNIQMKREFLPEVNAKGMAKWRHLPCGERELAMSTTNLNHEEMTVYLQKVEAHLVTEFGLRVPANPRDF